MYNIYTQARLDLYVYNKQYMIHMATTEQIDLSTLWPLNHVVHVHTSTVLLSSPPADERGRSS